MVHLLVKSGVRLRTLLAFVEPEGLQLGQRHSLGAVRQFQPAVEIPQLGLGRGSEVAPITPENLIVHVLVHVVFVLEVFGPHILVANRAVACRRRALVIFPKGHKTAGFAKADGALSLAATTTALEVQVWMVQVRRS